MKGIPVDKVRNLAILGNDGSGKTKLCEYLIAQSDTAQKAEITDLKTKFLDFNQEEIDRNITITSSPTYFSKNGYSFSLIDTPGYLDFWGETAGAMGIIDSGILVMDATADISLPFRKVWKELEKREIPKIIFVNKLDKENADFNKVVSNIRKNLSKKCIPAFLPVFENDKFKNVLNITTKNNLDKANNKEEAQDYFTQLMEKVAETDDSLLEKYFEEGELNNQDLKKGLRKAIIAGKIVPILCGAVKENIGVNNLFEYVVNYFPAPNDLTYSFLEENNLKPKKEEDLVSFVFKTVNDLYIGKLSYVRIYSGPLKKGDSLYNSTKKVEEKVSSLLVTVGKKQISVEEAGPGDIVAIPKLKETETNDTLCTIGKEIVLPPINFPQPVISYAINPKEKGEEEKISSSLHKIASEDLSIKIERDHDTKELVLSTLGELHKEVILNKLKNQFNLEIETSTPKIAYKETVSIPAEGHKKHKKQSGGRGQYAEVYLKLEPLPRAKGFEYVDEIRQGRIPRGFIPAIEKGIMGAMEDGIVAGFPVVDIRTCIYDGSFHDVDSSEMAFKIAGSGALKDAFKKARPVILEPIMKLEVIIPEKFVGDITGDLNSKRGRVQGIQSAGEGLTKITATIPASEISKYAIELKSLTRGQGTFTTEFIQYEKVSHDIQEKLVQAYNEKKAAGERG